MHPTGTSPVDAASTPAGILRHAALYLQRHGWHQRAYYGATPGTDDVSAATYYGATPPACVLGAIGMAVHGQAHPDPLDPELPHASAFSAAYGTLADHLILTNLSWIDSDEDTISGWNDHRDQSIGEVIAVLNAAANEWDRLHCGGAA